MDIVHTARRRTRCSQWEYLPGQFDQRADSRRVRSTSSSQAERPRRARQGKARFGPSRRREPGRTALPHKPPVESHGGPLEPRDTLAEKNYHPEPADVPLLEGFTAPDRGASRRWSPAWPRHGRDDVEFCQRLLPLGGPGTLVLTELRVLDTLLV